jgi:hypothetical protein
MPWIAAFLSNLVVTVAGYFSTYIGKRFAVYAAMATVLGTLTAALIAALNVLVASLAVAVPTQVCNAMGWLMPSNTVPCISAMFAARLLIWAYGRNTQFILMKNNL